MKNARIFGIVAAPLLLLLALTATLRLSSAPPESGDPPGDAVLLLPPPSAEERPADAATQKALEGIAAGQMRAVRRGDWPAALAFSTPAFRESVTPERFGQMIEVRYREMIRATKEEFDRGRLTGESARLRVEITLPDAARYEFVYDLTKENGSWLVAGCTPAIPIAPSRPDDPRNAGSRTGDARPDRPIP